MDYMGGNEQHDMDAQSSGKGFRVAFLIAAASILIGVIAVAAVLLIHGNVKTQKYNSFISSGNTYYSAGDYANALVQYQFAIEVDDKKESGYLNMSSAYIALGDYESATAILEQGYDRINSVRLQERVAYVQNLIATGQTSAAAVKLSNDEIKNLSKDAVAENAVFDMVAAYTYTEYFRDFGNPTSVNTSDASVIIYYSSKGFYTTYYDLENEKVLSNSKDMPLANVKPCEVRFVSVSSLFGSGEEIYVVSKDKLIEILGDNTLFYQDDDEKYYVQAEYKKCRITIETDANGNIVSENAWNKIEPLYRTGITEESDVDGSVSGYVQDAMTGAGMRAKLKVRNRGVRSGNALEELESSFDGSYSFEGESGAYTIEVSAAGYITEYLDVEIVKGQVKTGLNVVLSPEVASGDIRIVLTWGSFPSDLDSHTDGTSSAGSSFSISFRNRSVMNVGELDVDDTNGYGPETTTITDGNANFTFSVEDFTRSGSMNASGATVKVYIGGSNEPITYYVPAGEGNVWTVFSYSNGVVTPINTIQ